MPTEEENTQYLYLVLTNAGNPTIDWDAVGKAMELSKAAVSKRWSRLKQAVQKGEIPSANSYQFLWLCVKHSSRDKAMDWAKIAKKCNTTPGAASKRYSRMKQAFENGTSAPATFSKSQSATGDQGSSKILSKGTVKIPKKSKATTPGIKQEDYSGEDADISGNANIVSETSSKRKRTTAKKFKVEDEDNEKYKPDEDDLDSESEYGAKNQAKRAKGSGGPVKPRATPKPKTQTMSAPKVALKATAAVDPEAKETLLDDSDGPALPVHLNISNGNLLTSSVNPTEATTLITTEPSGNDLVAPVKSGDDWEEGDEEVFYDTNEFVEEMETQESLGVQNWLEEMGDV